MTNPRNHRPLRLFSLSACLWAIAFGVLSGLWALGVDIGVDLLSPTLVERFESPTAADTALLWATAFAKFIGGVIPLALGFGLALAIPRRILVWLCWIGGVFCTLYGIGDIIGGAFRAIDGADNAIWYAVLWGPIWLLGGVLYLGTAWSWRTLQRSHAAG